MKIVSTDILGSLGELLDRECWRTLDFPILSDNAPVTIAVEYPSGPTLHITLGVLRKARRAYFTIKGIYESERDLRKTVREEVYTILGEISETMMKGTDNE